MIKYFPKREEGLPKVIKQDLRQKSWTLVQQPVPYYGEFVDLFS